LLPLPRIPTDTARGLLNVAIYASAATGTPFTIRDASRHDGSRPRVKAEDIRLFAHDLWQRGELLMYKTLPTTGRPSIYFYPVHRWELRGIAQMELTFFAPTEHPAQEPVFGQLVQRIEPETDEQHEPETESEAPSEPPAHAQPHAPVSGTGSGEAGSGSDRKALSAPPQDDGLSVDEQGRLQFDPTFAYTVVRKLVTKSMRERKYGCTFGEMRWVLERQGFTPEQATWALRALSATEPEAYKADGLTRDLPKSPNNKTEEVRYRLRTPAQAMPDEVAEFEAQQAREYVLENSTSIITSVLTPTDPG
jgi:hypothetical protein